MHTKFQINESKHLDKILDPKYKPDPICFIFQRCVYEDKDYCLSMEDKFDLTLTPLPLISSVFIGKLTVMY